MRGAWDILLCDTDSAVSSASSSHTVFVFFILPPPSRILRLYSFIAFGRAMRGQGRLSLALFEHMMFNGAKKYGAGRADKRVEGKWRGR